MPGCSTTHPYQATTNLVLPIPLLLLLLLLLHGDMTYSWSKGHMEFDWLHLLFPPLTKLFLSPVCKGQY